MAQQTPTKQQRRHKARIEREALLRKAARHSQLRRIGIVALVFVVVAGVTAMVLTHHKSSTSAASWAPEYTHLKERLKVLGLPAGPSMAETLHHHDLLQIYVNGEPVTVPSQVGIDAQAAYLTSLHTHDTSGIIHVESPDQRSFTLGQFFSVWGIRLTPTCINTYCATGSATLKAFVNGASYTGDPRTIPLTQHEDIVLAYGTPAQLPNPVPSTYAGTISRSCTPDC
jgi:hypothetical protein